MAALTRFISKSVNTALPFLAQLKGNKKFEWGEEQSKAFLAVKEHLKSLPTIIGNGGRTTLVYLDLTKKRLR